MQTLMVIDLNEFLPVILYISLTILIVVVIILSIRLINVLKKVNTILDNVEGKVNQLNGVFNLVDNLSDGINSVSEKISNFVCERVSKLMENKKGTDNDEKEE